MASIFSRIVAGEIPSYKIAETDDCYAFLDINPLKKGHTLVIPKKEVDRLFDLDDMTYEALFQFTKKVADAIKKVIPCDRVGMAVIGLEVPHAHIHLIPLDDMRDMNFAKPKMTFTKEEFQKIAIDISAQML
jgi:histidine triad (HIT) family protein